MDVVHSLQVDVCCWFQNVRKLQCPSATLPNTRTQAMCTYLYLCSISYVKLYGRLTPQLMIDIAVCKWMASSKVANSILTDFYMLVDIIMLNKINWLLPCWGYRLTMNINWWQNTRARARARARAHAHKHKTNTSYPTSNFD